MFPGQEYFARIGAYSRSQMALRIVARSVEAFKPDPKALDITKKQLFKEEKYHVTPVANAKDYPPFLVTWNMGNYMGRECPMLKNASFLNVSEFPGVEDFVLKTGLAHPVLKKGEQVVRYNDAKKKWYPVYQFEERALRAIDREGYERYLKSYDRQAAEEERLKNMRLAYRYGSCCADIDPKIKMFDNVIFDDDQI